MTLKDEVRIAMTEVKYDKEFPGMMQAGMEAFQQQNKELIAEKAALEAENKNLKDMLRCAVGYIDSDLEDDLISQGLMTDAHVLHELFEAVDKALEEK